MKGPTIKFDSADEALNFAIQKELEANQFYIKWADKVTSKAVRQVLVEFAEEELKHRDLLENIQAGETFKAGTKNVVDLHIADNFTATLPESQMTYQDALRVAIQREVGAIELYQYLGDQVENAQLKDIFYHLEKEETSHKVRLESIYDDDFMSEN